MGTLILHLLGAPAVTCDGEPLTGFRSTKARALLFYVVAGGQPQSRSKLAGLLWGELPEENANANLRKTLTNLRKLAGSHLEITRQTVAVAEENAPRLDVQVFERALDDGDERDLAAAVDLYRGDFLDGFYLQGAPAFERWMLAERHRLRERFLVALKGLAEAEAARGELRSAIDRAERLLSLEPLREDAHRLLMRLLAQNGQRSRALAQYKTCAAILEEELGVEPGDETTALLQQIEEGAFAAPAGTAPHNLPAPLTSFVGRRQLLARVQRWLAGDPQRLLTVSGPGGVGKTRLAQQAGRQVVDDFRNGVWLVSLTSIEDVSELPSHLAATLGFTFVGRQSPREQVVRYLRRRSLLLILDNAEHLVSQALSELLTDLLSQAPDVRIIVTSRRRLQLQAEKVMLLPGLAYP
ncbi:MAG: AfsR/SARP family transcriptional regulator, partial [Chloroflexota bacterium]